MKKRLIASLCAALLVLAVIIRLNPAQGAWDDGLMFIVINDQPMTLSADVMPILVGGTVYVPYILFDANQNGGFNLGIYNGNINQKLNTLTFYDMESKNLIFDLNTGISYDYLPDGEEQRPRAIIRSGRIYVSASSFCNYFGSNLHYYYTTTKYGYPLVRISNDDAQLNDQGFVSSASISSLLNILNNYYRSLNPQTSQTPAITVAPTPEVSVSPRPDDRKSVRTYLAFRCDTGQATETVLDSLSAERRTAVLFFDPEQLSRQDDLIRRALGDGHVIGLLAKGATPAEAEASLAEGNRLLEHIALTNTRIILSDGSAELTGALQSAGWLCWRADLDGRGLTAAALVRALEGRESTTRITLDDSTNGLRALTRLLTTLREDRYDYRLAVETEF